MKKHSIFVSMKSRKFRHGGYATLMVVIVIAAVVFASLIADLIPLKIDLTRNRIFTLSKQTLEVLDGLTTDVTITTISFGGLEDPGIREILRRYAMRSRRIALQTIDPDRDPGWSRQYVRSGGALRKGSIVVATKKRFKVIDPYDLSVATSSVTDPDLKAQATSLSAEKYLTSALLYATAERDLVAYALQGHGEVTIAALNLETAVAYENYAVRHINLLVMDAVPPDADVLLMIGPAFDLSVSDSEKIRSYLEAGGRAVILLDLPAIPNSRPVIAGLLKSYGIAMRNLLVTEGDSTRIALNNPLYLLPKLEYHDIVKPLEEGNLPVFMPMAQAIDLLAARRKSLSIEPLLSSSAKSWGKENYQNIQSTDRADGDPGGPFTLAVAISDTPENPSRRGARLVVAGSSAFLQDQYTGAMPGNSEFFLNALGWLEEKKLGISIRPKDLKIAQLRINMRTSYIMSGIAVILMPAIVLALGFIVWLRRRHL